MGNKALNMNRKFLLLQGPVGPFFKQFGRAIRKTGHFAMQVNFNNGDAFFGTSENSVNFCAPLDKWPEFFEEILTSQNITDVIMYGDCRFIHKTAIEKCGAMGIEYHLLEEGYLRPYWVTLEKKGINANSDISKDKNLYTSYKTSTEPVYKKFSNSTLLVGIYSIIYYFAYIKRAGCRFVNYSHHSQINYKKVWHNWFFRVLFLPLRRIYAAVQRYSLKNKNFFLVPLQLDRDSQILVHSDFADMLEFSRHIMQSFKANAPATDLLVFKNHPLDCGSRKMKRQVLQLAEENDISKRVVFIDAGKLPALLERAKGVITINSTAGISAISHGKKLMALGRAIYNFDGLTYQGKLDDFWQDRKYLPNIGMFHKFRHYLLDSRQVNGCYYSFKGRRILVNNLMSALGIWRVEDNVIKAEFGKERSKNLKLPSGR